LTLSLAFASDFADIFEVRGVQRARRGRTWSKPAGAGGIVLSYRGLDGALRETALNFEPAPTALLDSVASYKVELAPGARRTIFVTASSRGRMPKSTRSFFQGLIGLHREKREATQHIT